MIIGGETVKRNVVVIDSDRACQRLISGILSANNYEVSLATGSGDGYAMISATNPDLVILETVLPDDNGIKIIRMVREWSQMPIIVVSSANGEKRHVEALDAGADLYFDKPFSPSELLAGVRVCVRHITVLEAAKGLGTKSSYISGGLFVDYNLRCVKVSGKEIHLTRNEFKILSLLCRYSGRVLTYDYIMKSIWGPHENGDNGILRVNVTNIRRKIEPDIGCPIYLFTENGVGYRIAGEDAPEIKK